MPTRGESGGHLAISHWNGYWESRKQSVDGNTMAYSIPGETNEAATWSPPPQVQVQTEHQMFDEIPRDRNRFSAARIECTEEGLCRPPARLFRGASCYEGRKSFRDASSSSVARSVRRRKLKETPQETTFLPLFVRGARFGASKLASQDGALPTCPGKKSRTFISGQH